ncbi:MAG: hypothetical protein J6U54_08500 [Clostridiales bacterium]|nr:hypothetical protein [Clostridiales bacterium]
MLGIMFKDFGKELKVVLGYFLVFVGFLAVQDNNGFDHYIWEDYIFNSSWWSDTGIYVLAITALYFIVSGTWKVIRGFIYNTIFDMMNKLKEKKDSKV